MISRMTGIGMMFATIGLGLAAPVSADPAITPGGRLVAFLSIDQAVDVSSHGSSIELAQAGNRPPVVNRRITDRRVQEGAAFSFGIPANTFTDPDGDPLRITAQENVGWMRFNQRTRRLLGTPLTFDVPALVRVRASDEDGASATTTFRVRITPRTLDDDTGQSTPSPDVNGNSDSRDPSISADGRFVAHAFENVETDPPEQSIVVRDFTFGNLSGLGSFAVAGPISFVVNSGEVLFANPSISADGRVVAFVGQRPPPRADTVAVGVVRIADSDPLRLRTQFLQDILDFDDPFDRDSLVSSTEVSLSANGRIVVFEECTATIEQCSSPIERGTNIVVAKIGAGRAPLVIQNGSSPSISRSGHRLAYKRLTSSGEQEVVIATLNDSRTRVIRTTVIGLGSNPSVSTDGRFVAFESDADDLVEGDINVARDIFVYDRIRRTTALVSIDADGDQAEGNSSNPSLSEDGSRVTFELTFSDDFECFFETVCPQILARNLDARGEPRGELRVVSVDDEGNPGDLGGGGGSFGPSLSADGRFVTFQSFSTNLVPGGAAANGSEDNAGSAVFVAPAFPDHAPEVDFGNR
jgi:Tol biopolymer transport system component